MYNLSGGLTMNNHMIAQKLLAHARLLQGGANLYRIRAYRHAAMIIDGLERSVAEMLAQRGRSSLASLPGIGDHLAASIEILVKTGEVAPRSARRPECALS
jgi:putative hydrolase